PPVTALVCGSVMRNSKLAGILVAGAIPQFVAAWVPEAITVANAVAAVPTGTERLPGSTAAGMATGLLTPGERSAWKILCAPLPQPAKTRVNACLPSNGIAGPTAPSRMTVAGAGRSAHRRAPDGVDDRIALYWRPFWRSVKSPEQRN